MAKRAELTQFWSVKPARIGTPPKVAILPSNGVEPEGQFASF